MGERLVQRLKIIYEAPAGCRVACRPGTCVSTPFSTSLGTYVRLCAKPFNLSPIISELCVDLLYKFTIWCTASATTTLILELNPKSRMVRADRSKIPKILWKFQFFCGILPVPFSRMYNMYIILSNNSQLVAFTPHQHCQLLIHFQSFISVRVPVRIYHLAVGDYSRDFLINLRCKCLPLTPAQYKYTKNVH